MGILRHNFWVYDTRMSWTSWTLVVWEGSKSWVVEDVRLSTAGKG